GIYDQVGGGFHRYATDERWLVPHFEKMLYDNALLAVAYLEAHQVTGRDNFARVAGEILRYVERDMTSAEGVSYSASDADSPTPDG
ncbi:thioredoxin domain-containing protein, partial [Escherichia coli]